ncbi:MAG: flagellar export chaperone FlgN [Anaerovoracaceae bacterium]|jgi:hypothetical protein
MIDTKSYNNILDDFHKYLQGVLKLYQDTVPVLKEQLKAIEKDEVEAVNASLTSQQALILSTKSFDRTVASYLSKLDISASNLTQMISQIPESQRLRFYELLGQFENTMTEINFYKEKCNVLIQSKLHVIDKALSRQQHKKDHTIYNEKASEVRGSLISKSFEKKV